MDFFRKIKNSYLQWILSEEDSYFSIQNQEKIRRGWLISSCLFLVYGILLLPLMDFFGLLNLGLSLQFIWMLSLGIALINFLIFYIFAYKKHGTKWLMLYIISLPLGLLSDLRFYNGTGVALVILALTAGIRAYYWIHCVRLYKINLYKKRQKESLI